MHKLMQRLALAAALAAGLAALPASADSVRIDGRYGSIVITDNERNAIHNYYHHEAEAAPKGKKLNKGMQKRLAKGKGLPPGWQKKMARGEVVPDDVWAVHEPLPPVIISRLPPQPEGVITVRVDTKIVRVIAATKIILDVFDL